MKRSKKMHGVGINDATYTQQIKTYIKIDGKKKWTVEWVCPYYSYWCGILDRGFSEAFKRKQPAYKDVTVCEEWLTFSNFKAWMETQDWEGKYLDKDLLVQGNKIYSPETCLFVSRQVNNFMIEQSSAKKTPWPTGVSFHKQHQKFYARCSNPFTKKSQNIGLFSSPEEAHLAWAECKLDFAIEIAKLQTDPRIAAALTERYEGVLNKAKIFCDFSPCRQMGTLEEAQEVKKQLDTQHGLNYSYRIVEITWID